MHTNLHDARDQRHPVGGDERRDRVVVYIYTYTYIYIYIYIYIYTYIYNVRSIKHLFPNYNRL